MKVKKHFQAFDIPLECFCLIGVEKSDNFIGSNTHKGRGGRVHERGRCGKKSMLICFNALSIYLDYAFPFSLGRQRKTGLRRICQNAFEILTFRIEADVI